LATYTNAKFSIIAACWNRLGIIIVSLQGMLGEMVKARLRLPQPVRLQNITELTQNAKERTADILQQNGTETLSIHVDFSAHDSSPDPELSTYV
jgi:hypothetical protein